MLQTTNSAIIWMDPILNEQGESKFAEYIRIYGWKWSITQLNERADISRVVSWEKFEGSNNAKEDMKEGIFYGQLLNGLRDGIGIVFCIDKNSLPLLYECEWKLGRPFKQGRILTVDSENHWMMREVAFNQSYWPSAIIFTKSELDELREMKFEESKTIINHEVETPPFIGSSATNKEGSQTQLSVDFNVDPRKFYTKQENLITKISIRNAKTPLKPPEKSNTKRFISTQQRQTPQGLDSQMTPISILKRLPSISHTSSKSQIQETLIQSNTGVKFPLDISIFSPNSQIGGQDLNETFSQISTSLLLDGNKIPKVRNYSCRSSISQDKQMPPTYQRFRSILLKENLFDQKQLDRIHAFLNDQLNDFIPDLDDDDHSPLSNFISEHGWKWSIHHLNAFASISKVVKCTQFEGVKREFAPILKKGIYYGQLKDGKRHGLGIVYCTNSENAPVLYECEWKRGVPTRGRYTIIIENQWATWEGEIDQRYLLTGEGVCATEARGRYEGAFKLGRQHGQGRWIERGGESQEGMWQDGYRVGIHSFYSKEGWHIGQSLFTYR
ncbi:hypothetical protein FGO68_gene7233 [Halteria grandinella]|uniref:Uncharacterized protein n=1 Tax=Halteria grandinella TaxID=5974 RepID=A0A8J8P111_HALGN|nr:hypothetical protein FGO68_gene7233 [Halteria grandinella]